MLEKLLIGLGDQTGLPGEVTMRMRPGWQEALEKVCRVFVR